MTTVAESPVENQKLDFKKIFEFEGVDDDVGGEENVLRGRLSLRIMRFSLLLLFEE